MYRQVHLVWDPTIPTEGLQDRLETDCLDFDVCSFAVSEASNMLASYHRGRKQTVTFNSFSSQTIARGRKRKDVLDETTETKLNGLDVELANRWGATKDLCNLVFNDDGSLLMGASEDGDLFAWRA